MEPTQQHLRRPAIGGAEREQAAYARRINQAILALSHPGRPALNIPSNGDNAQHDTFPMAFTKGLHHDAFGFAATADFEALVKSLTQYGAAGYPDAVFDVKTAKKAHETVPEFLSCKPRPAENRPVGFRKWESPLAGAYFCNDGPDPAGVAMAPAPRFGGSELTAEMAEVYAMALVRDMSFDALADPTSPLTRTTVGGATVAYTKRDGDPATVQDLIDALGDLSWFTSQTPRRPIKGLDATDHEKRRRLGQPVTAANLFRGSAPGDDAGSYISSFLTMGAGRPTGHEIAFGAQTIDQHLYNAKPGLDYMTSWAEWLDVQQGLDLRGLGVIEAQPTAMTTPRHLASYVHVDQLYQAYFNACLILLTNGMPADPGFPNAAHETRGPFATFGGPHILSLMTEVASRGLRAVRRQKFQIHRRARPERLAAMLTLLANGLGDKLGNAHAAAQEMLDELAPSVPGPAGEILHWVRQLNADRNGAASVAARRFECTPLSSLPHQLKGAGFDGCNFLLPMAFPEGSPMHPAYGAGHATVAGACVTMLKAFFAMSSDAADSVPTTMDVIGGDPALTVEGELNKLAANISIGRNFAGVHYYTDYYDSLRMGERVAVGMLHEMMLDYNEPVHLSFRDFDGVHVRISTDGGHSAASVQVAIDGDTSHTAFAAWWTRNIAEFEDSSLDTGNLASFAAQILAGKTGTQGATAAKVAATGKAKAGIEPAE
ncbi:hypothetical protein [Pseudooceanicola sp. LIPI14-2-Ac024]|uniref:hypothetical protein n=1 Tax=Pseudooceanicola sp. LIPI14-2-Ac024 TaxID=3344875 RepID=UPI0035CF2253